MDDYIIRKVIPNDYSFLADVIIGAEKGNSLMLSFSKLFQLEEKNVKELIIAMLEEDIDGCEFSPSSFLVVNYGGIPVAALAGWIEGYYGYMPSKILKANLLSFFLDEGQIQFLKSKSHIISDLIIEREKMTLQFEYLYVSRCHRGRNLHVRLVNEHIAIAFSTYPELSKASAQVYANNFASIKAIRQIGFNKVRSYKSDKDDILGYLPFNEKLLMEKDLNQITYGKE